MALPKLSPEELSKIADRLTPIAVKQRQNSIKFRQPKLDKILRAEELYFNIVTRTLRGRFNIPLPIVSGFVDTLLSKIDDEITVNFDPGPDADKIRCRKYSGAIKKDAEPTRGMWRIKDLLTKKLAIFSGVGINMMYSESDPKYKNNLFIIDAFDFHCEATGGWNLNDHFYKGVDNIYRTKFDLENGSQYNKKQVTKLITFKPTDDQKTEAEALYRNRQQRHKTLGLDVDSNAYTGVDTFNLTQWNMYDTTTGRWFYLFFDPQSAIWVRIEPLEEITGETEDGTPKSMFMAWHTHPDAWNFWSKSPLDDVIPIAMAMKILVNFMFDEVQKRLWGQRLFDPEMITDPSMLEWDRPDKLIMATVPNGKKISDGVYEFPTGDKSTVTINMLDYFRNFVAVESGVTPQEKGNSDEKLLGIAKINMGEVADRLGLTNIFYTQFYAELGDAWLRGARMCLPAGTLIQMLGEDGTESTELDEEDKNFTAHPSIRITGGKTEARKNQEMQEQKNAALVSAIELFPNKLNAKLALEALLTNGHWTMNEITPMLDVTTDGDEDESTYASMAIEAIIENKKPKVYMGATTRFMQKIIDYAVKRQTDEGVTNKLMAYVLQHKDIVIQNMAREAMLRNMNPENDPTGPGAAPAQAGGSSNSVAAEAPAPQAAPSAAAVATSK